MAANEIYDHQNRSGVVWWVGCISLILVTILPSHTALRGPSPSTPTTADLYQIDTPSFLTQSLSKQPAMYSIP